MSKLTLIIPTKNNAQVLYKNVSSLSTIADDNLHVLIVDNSDKENELVSALTDLHPNLQYIYNQNHLSFTENFEIGLDYVKTKFVSFIGEDDFIHPEIGHILEKLDRKEQFDCLIGNNSFRYYWSDVKHPLFGELLSNKLFTSKITHKTKYVDPIKQILKVGAKAAERFFDLPKVYHGIVKVELLAKIKEQNGSYFPGPTPDMAFAAHAAILRPKVLKIDFPLFILGTSKSSGGGKGLSRKHNWGISECGWLDKRIRNTWNSKIPRYLSGTTIWAESFYRASQNSDQIRRSFNLERFIARMLIFDGRLEIRTIIKFIKKQNGLKFIRLFGEIVCITTERIMHLILNIYRIQFSYKKINQIKELYIYQKKFKPKIND